MTAEVGQTYTWDVTKSANPTSLSFTNTCADTAGPGAPGPDHRELDPLRADGQRRHDDHDRGHGDQPGPSNDHRPGDGQDLRRIGADDSPPPGHRQRGLTCRPTLRWSSCRTRRSTRIGDDLQRRCDGNLHRQADRHRSARRDKRHGVGDVPARRWHARERVGRGERHRVDHRHRPGVRRRRPIGRRLHRRLRRGRIDHRSRGLAIHRDEQRLGDLTKTVTIDQPRITSGTLSDTATITGDGESVLDTASASVGITAAASASLQINKTISAGSLRNGESATFNFDISGPGGFSDDVAVTFTLVTRCRSRRR